MCTRTCTSTRQSTRTVTCTHARVQKHTHARTHTRTYARGHTHTHMHADTHMTRAHAHMHTQICMHTLTLTRGEVRVKEFATRSQNNKRYGQHATGTQHGSWHSDVNTQMVDRYLRFYEGLVCWLHPSWPPVCAGLGWFALVCFSFQ